MFYVLVTILINGGVGFCGLDSHECNMINKDRNLHAFDFKRKVAERRNPNVTSKSYS